MIETGRGAGKWWVNGTLWFTNDEPRDSQACDGCKNVVHATYCEADGTDRGGDGESEDYPAHSCKALRTFHKQSTSGAYWISANDNVKPLKMWCDMALDGGSLTLFSQLLVASLPLVIAQKVPLPTFIAATMPCASTKSTAAGSFTLFPPDVSNRGLDVGLGFCIWMERIWE